MTSVLLLVALGLAIAAFVRSGRYRGEIAVLRRQLETLRAQTRDLGKAVEALREGSPSGEQPGARKPVIAQAKPETISERAAVKPAPVRPAASNGSGGPGASVEGVAPAAGREERSKAPAGQWMAVDGPQAVEAAPAAAESPAETGGSQAIPAQPAARTQPVARSQPPAPNPAASPPPAPGTRPEAKPIEGPTLRDAAAAWRRLEESITSRWLVWLGAGTIALAGAFLVKYSIDQGWLGPAVRTALAFLMGASLVAAGEWLRRQPMQRAIAALRPNHVPPALTGAGLFTVFASVYAAYELYGLIGPVAAFVLLAAVALGAVAMAVLQGPLIAALGLIGGFTTPLLVAGGQPWPWALYTYLLVLTAAGLAVVRFTAWWWLAWATLAGAALWTLPALLGSGTASGTAPLGVYLLLLCGLVLTIRHKQEPSGHQITWSRGLEMLSQPERIVWAAAVVVALLAAALVWLDGYGPASLITLIALAGLYMAAGHREATFDGLAVVAALIGCLLIAAWPVPAITLPDEGVLVDPGFGIGLISAAALMPIQVPFLAVSLVLSALFGLGGFLALWWAKRPVLWAWVSAAVPTVLLAVWYWKIAEFTLDLRWSAYAAVLASLGFAAAKRVYTRPKLPGRDLVLGAYATATVVALSLAAAMTVEQAWLTVALALQLPVLAWLHDRLQVKSLRLLALELAVVVILRLVLNPQIFDYPLGTIPAASWVIYGYGIPAAAFWLAALLFRRRADDKVVMVLEAGTVAFTALLVTLEVRLLIAGSMLSLDYRLVEQSIQSIAWLALGTGCLVQYRRHARKVMLWAWRLLAGMAAGQVLLLQTLLFNPLWTGNPVGDWPVVDVLLLAYLAPAGFTLYAARELGKTGRTKGATGVGLVGLCLVFVYASLELRHLFQGSVLSRGSAAPMELYSYAALWLSLAYGWLLWHRRRGGAALLQASRGLALLAAGQIIGVHGLIANPLWSGAEVGAWPLLNLLALAYLVPAGFGLLLAREFRRAGDPKDANVAMFAGLGLVLAYVSLELRHWFHGPVLSQGPTGLAEIYSYAALYLTLAYASLSWHRRWADPALNWAWRGLALLGAAQVAFVHGLGFNPLWSGDSVGAWPVANLLALGYLVPAGFAFLFARQLKRIDEPKHASMAMLVGLGLVFAYLSLELRHWFHGPVLSQGPTSLAEVYSYAALWLALAYAWLSWHRRQGDLALHWAWRGLALLAAGQVAVVHGLAFNPLWAGGAVGTLPLLNLLALAYLVPAGFAFLFAHAFLRQGEGRNAAVAALTGCGLAFLYVLLEVRHVFHGTVLSHGGTSGGELYGYSAACLLFAFALLAAGIWKGISILRYISLALLLVAVAKVFLVDMAALTGLLRVVSFLGLGLSLVGIGYFYQRYVFPPGGPATAADGREVAVKPV